MAVLSFKVQADYEKVVRLREEIAKLETQLKSFGKNTPISEIKAVEASLAAAKSEFSAVASEAAKAGATLSADFKGRIKESTRAMNDLAAKIIEQKDVVRNVEFDVKRLAAAYRELNKSGNSKKAAETKAEYDAAKKALEEEKAALFALTQEKAKATLATKKLKDEYKDFEKQAKDTKKANDGVSLSLGKIAGLIGGVAALKQLGSAIVQVRGQFQDMETAIETLVGKETTARILPEIKELAKTSPLTMTDIVGAEKMMLGFNIEADKTIKYLKALSDVSMGNGQKFNSLTLAFSQMSAAGKLMGQDLNQMINAGFNPLQQISEKTGKSIAQLKEEMSKGAVTAEMVQQAFIDATSAGGKFYNMSENASKTINGQISMMQDAMDAMFNEIGTKSEGVIIKSIKTATSLIQNYETIGKVLAGLVTTYGAYRTAVLLSTAATSKHTIAEIALTNVRIAARKAQQALNAAMLTNPYVALATVVAGLTAAMIAFGDSSTAAERAQSLLAKHNEEAAKKATEHANAIQGLIDKVLDETQAEGERILALEALKKEYPKIFEQYDIETLKLADILNLKQQISEIDANRKVQSDKEYIKELDAQIKKAEADLQNAMTMGNVQYIKNTEKQIETLKQLRSDKVEEMNVQQVARFTATLSDKTTEDLKAIKEQLAASIYEFEGELIDPTQVDAFHKAVDEAIKSLTEGPKYADDYAAAKKKYEDDLKAFKEAERDKTKFTTAEYQKRKQAKEASEAAFKKLGGNPKEKEDKNEVKEFNEEQDRHEKREAQDKKNAVERARTVVDMENMVEQARIDAMKEGAAKQRAQQALDNKKELQDLERQKEDYIEKVVEAERAVFEAQEEQKAKNDKTYKKKAFDSETSRASVDTKAYDDAINYTRAKQIAQEDGFVKTLYDQYKSYEDKKKDMEKAYLSDILEMNSAYLESGDEKYVRSIEERHKAYIQALNKLESEYGTEDYKLIFGDPEKMTSATIEKALETARKKMSQLDKEADPETFQALSEAIERLEDARDNNPFQGWDTSVMGLIQKLYQIRNIRKDIKKYESEGNADAQKAAEGQLERAKGDLNRALVGTGVAQFGDALATAAASMKQVAEASGDIDLMKQAEALEKAGGFISSVASGAASGGWIGAIVGGATSLMNMLISTITETKVVAAEAKKAFDDYLKDVASKARSINEEDYETIFGIRTLEKVVEASEKASMAWADYEDVLNNSKGGAFRKGGEEMILPLGLSEQLVWEGKKQNASNAYKVPSLKERFPDLFNEDGTIKADVAKSILDSYSKYSGEQWYQYLQEAYDALADYEENLKVVDNYLTSLFSNVGSEIADAIMQGNDALEVLEQNAGEIFKSIAKEMIMSTLISQDFIDKYKKMLRDAMATEGASDDAAVLEGFVDELSGNITAATEKWEELKRIAEEKGIDLLGVGDETQQSASSKGYQSLSEDTGNELVGRALAQYESNLRMEESMRSAKESIDLMAAGQIQIRDIAAESRALIADSYLELQQIRENTGMSAKELKALNSRMAEWDSKIKSL